MTMGSFLYNYWTVSNELQNYESTEKTNIFSDQPSRQSGNMVRELHWPNFFFRALQHYLNYHKIYSVSYKKNLKGINMWNGEVEE